MDVRPYQAEMADAWNALNARAVNGHFLFDRRFMDYHADRFRDGSLLIERDGELLALLPVNLAEDEAWSHQGLTFGGLIHAGLGVQAAIEALEVCARRLRDAGARTLTYKAQPWIYPRAPAQQDIYWLFKRDATLLRRDVSAAIDYRARGHLSGRRIRGARKAQKSGLTFERSQDWAGYWWLLEQVLGERHAVTPVHSLAEIELLAALFPQEIALFLAIRDAEPQAGVVMFRGRQVAHAQYIAVGEAGRDTGALDGLFDHLIELHAATFRFFDFGISNTHQGRVLNEGLMTQKEEFGASAIVHDTYLVEL